MRSIEQISNNFKSYLTQLNSQLSNYNKFSNLYFLIRSFAAILNEQETDFDLKLTQINLLTATGLYLDQVGYEYGVYREVGKTVSGYVLASTLNDVTISAGTVIVDQTNEYQFEVDIDSLIQGTDNLISVTSLTDKDIYLDAGTELFSIVYPAITFMVGVYKDLDGIAQTPISGGTAIEDDNNFRARIFNTLFNLRGDTVLELEQLIYDLELVTKVIIQNNEPRVGYFTVFVDTQDQDIKESIIELIEINLPLGYNYVLKSFALAPINIALNIQLNNLLNIDSKKAELAEFINNYFLELAPGEAVNFALLNKAINLANIVASATIISPEFDFDLNNNQVPKLNDLSITLEV